MKIHNNRTENENMFQNKGFKHLLKLDETNITSMNEIIFSEQKERQICFVLGYTNTKKK